MAYRTVVLPAVSRSCRGLGLSREGMLRLMDFLHITLPAQAAALRGNRDPDDDRLFLCRLELFDADGWHGFTVAVDDVTAPDTLFVTGLAHRRRPFGG